MEGLVFADKPQSGQQYEEQLGLQPDPFFPRIDLANLRDVMRVDNNISTARLQHTAEEAVLLVNDLIRSRKPDKPLEAADTARYRRAVYCYTKSLLLENYADTDATGKTGTRAEAKQEQASDYRRDGHFAVSDLLGHRRCDAELI